MDVVSGPGPGLEVHTDGAPAAATSASSASGPSILAVLESVLDPDIQIEAG